MSALIATHETSFQRCSGRMDRYSLHAYASFPNLVEGDPATYEFLAETNAFLDWLRARFMQTDFEKIDGRIIAHLVCYQANPPCGGYGKPGLLEPWGAANVPVIDAMELGLMFTNTGAYICKSEWPAEVLADWAARQTEPANA